MNKSNHLYSMRIKSSFVLIAMPKSNLATIVVIIVDTVSNTESGASGEGGQFCTTNFIFEFSHNQESTLITNQNVKVQSCLRVEGYQFAVDRAWYEYLKRL